jgi:hypothetical protein
VSGRRVFLDDVGAGDVGRHQVGGELDAIELEIEHTRERVNQQRLRQTRNADDEAVAADKQRQQHLGHHIILTDDQLAKFGHDAVAALFHPLCQGNVVWRLQFHGVGHRAIQARLLYEIRGASPPRTPHAFARGAPMPHSAPAGAPVARLQGSIRVLITNALIRRLCN